MSCSGIFMSFAAVCKSCGCVYVLCWYAHVLCACPVLVKQMRIPHKGLFLSCVLISLCILCTPYFVPLPNSYLPTLSEQLHSKSRWKIWMISCTERSFPWIFDFERERSVITISNESGQSLLFRTRAVSHHYFERERSVITCTLQLTLRQAATKHLRKTHASRHKICGIQVHSDQGRELLECIKARIP